MLMKRGDLNLCRQRTENLYLGPVRDDKSDSTPVLCCAWRLLVYLIVCSLIPEPGKSKTVLIT